jgi:hypothetical protein
VIPTGLPPKIAGKLLLALRCGGHRSTAARFAGIQPAMLAAWLRQPGEPYETLRAQVEQAEAAVELRMLSIVAKSSDPRARLWLLERKSPTRWTDTRPAPSKCRPGIVDVTEETLKQGITGYAIVGLPSPPRQDQPGS